MTRHEYWTKRNPSHLVQKIEIQYDGLFMFAEVLIKAKRKGFSFYEFPVEQTQRVTGIASASKVRNVLVTLSNIVSFFYKFKFRDE